MEIITAIGNEKFYKEIKKESIIKYPDIQYQEAVLEILEKNKKIKILVLSSILPGELTIKEFINIIRYNYPNLIIFIILENEDKKIENFLIAKGITNIYFNNKTTYEEIIKEINNKQNNISDVKVSNNNRIKKYIKKIRKIMLNKIKTIKNKSINNKKNNTKIISIIGAPKIGKSIFLLIFNKIIKNKKILIVDFNAEKNNLKIIIGKKIKNSQKINNNIIKIKNNRDILLIKSEDRKKYQKIIFEDLVKKYDYIFFEIRDVENEKEIIAKSQKLILLVEGNLLGIKETKDILSHIIYDQKIQKDNINIIFNKHNSMSISMGILKLMFADFRILPTLHYDKRYNLFINSNGKILNNKIKKEYKKIIKKI